MSTHAPPPPPRHREWKIGCKVYIGNLAEGASKQDIEGAFGKFGQLRNVWVARNPPGFAFVEFEDGRDAEDACRNLDGTRIAGSRIKAEMSHGRTRRTRPGGYRGGGPPHPGAYGGRPPYHGPHRGDHHNGGGMYPYHPPHHGPPRGGHGPSYMDRHPRERHPPRPPRSPIAIKEFRRYSRSRSNSIEKSPGQNNRTARPRTPPSRAS